jgi:hypothetical protein
MRELGPLNSLGEMGGGRHDLLLRFSMARAEAEMDTERLFPYLWDSLSPRGIRASGWI